MKKRIIIGLVLTSSIFVFPGLAQAYSAMTTHRAITNESAKVFNHYYSARALSPSQINLLIKGNVDEDTPPRWLNHFYDPVHQIGFRGLRTSKDWAENTTAQAALTNKTPLAEYFSASGDYSWERAIYDYVYDDKNRALEALGHTLHLIQDATVPDHTRNDAHPIWSTYENYAKQFEVSNLRLADKLIGQKQTPIIFPALGDYFDYLANFSNNNFFSDDTILAKNYYRPIVEKEIIKKLSDGKNYKFGVNNFGKLSLIYESFNRNNGEVEKSYSLRDIDHEIPSDYWSNLSTKAILGSAGVIKLFFDEVEKEKQTKRLFEKNKSLVEKFLDSLDKKITNLLASVALVNSKPVILPIITGDILATTTDLVAPTEEPKEDSATDEINQAEIERLARVLEKLQEQVNRILAERANQAGQTLVDETAQTLVTTGQIISSGGGGGSLAPAIGDLTNPATSTDTIVISSPTITSPTDFSVSFATTSITFLGQASSSLVIFNDFDETLATTSDVGEWSLTIDNLVQGSSTINFFARDDDGHVSLPVAIDLAVDSLPLTLNFSVNNCALSLASDFCLLRPTSTLSFAWFPTKVGDYGYDLMRETDDGWNWSWEKVVTVNDLTATINTALSAEDSEEFRWQVLARSTSSSEVVASSSVLTTIFHPRPVVINEIGWAGTIASNLDEWLELKNYLNDYSINLADYYLTDSNQTWRINLSGSIAPEGYYLIERGNDEVISNRSADLVDNFVSDESAKAFDLANVGLKLWRQTETGDELIDETPIWNKTGAEPSSLERTFESKISTSLATWEDNPGCNESDGPCALDRTATTTFGTPGVINSASIPRLW